MNCEGEFEVDLVLLGLRCGSFCVNVTLDPQETPAELDGGG